MEIIYNKGIVFSDKKLFDLVMSYEEDIKNKIISKVKGYGFYVDGKTREHVNYCVSYELYKGLESGVYKGGLISYDVTFDEFIESGELKRSKFSGNEKIVYNKGEITAISKDDVIIEKDIDKWVSEKETRETAKFIKETIMASKEEFKKKLIDDNIENVKKLFLEHIKSRSVGFISNCLKHLDDGNIEIGEDNINVDNLMRKICLSSDLFKQSFVLIKDEKYEELLNFVKTYGL